jgi:integrating conjugative element protein (TIGR03752 family)
MKANIVVKALAVIIVAVLLVVVIKGGKSDTATTNTQASGTDFEGLTAIQTGPSELDNGLAIDPLQDDFLIDQFGVDVDTPVETMRTLTNETRAVREDSVKLQEENIRLRQKIDGLLKMEENLNARIANRFENVERDANSKQRELEHTQDLTRGLVARLESKLEQLKTEEPTRSQTSANGYDINSADIPTGLGYDNTGMPVDYDQIVWTNPMEATVDPRDPSKIALPEFSLNRASLPELASGPVRARDKTKEERLIKAYTIPNNATLLGSVSMTALLGRIPVGGQVVDPYPFKLIVGEENLSSNGISIPGLTGIKMSGIAKGDWTLSCVSGQVNSMTFTFQDGTLVTYPEPGTQTGEPIAWFSDRYGIPCVTGKRITNAPSYLAQRIGLTAAGAYAQARADSEFTTSTNALGGQTKGLTGDPMTVAQNEAISSGLGEVGDWLDARQSNSFDAIYVEPGTSLVIHISEQLNIDYDPEGRKVNHYADFDRRSEHFLD